MKWQKEVKEVGWYWICQFYFNYFYRSNEYKNAIFPKPKIYIEYIEKNDKGFFIPSNYYDEYSEDEYFTEENKGKYCFMGPLGEPEYPNYKKVKGKWVVETENDISGEIPGTINMTNLCKELDKLDKEHYKEK